MQTSAEMSKTIEVLVSKCLNGTPILDDAELATNVTSMALAHGLTHQLREQLDESEKKLIGLQDLIHSHRMAMLRRNMGMAAETIRIVKILEASQIAAVAFKGSVLAELAYANLEARTSCDIDIFVSKDQVGETIDILLKEDYHLPEDWSANVLAGHLMFDCECSLINSKRGVSIDLHWEFTARNYSLALPTERFMGRLETIKFQNQYIQSFNRHDLVLILCLHASKHCWLKLEWSFTLAAFIKKHPDLDWALIRSEAELMNLTQIYFIGLLLAVEYFQAPIPSQLLQEIKSDATIASNTRTVKKWIAAGPGFLPTPFSVRCFHTRARPGFLNKIAYWWGVVSTPTEKEYRLPIPHSYWPLYFPVRMVRLLFEPLASLFSPPAVLDAQKHNRVTSLGN